MVIFLPVSLEKDNASLMIKIHFDNKASGRTLKAYCILFHFWYLPISDRNLFLLP